MFHATGRRSQAETLVFKSECFFLLLYLSGEKKTLKDSQVRRVQLFP